MKKLIAITLSTTLIGFASIAPVFAEGPSQELINKITELQTQLNQLMAQKNAVDANSVGISKTIELADDLRLKQGDKRSEVGILQTVLAYDGYFKGNVTEYFGPLTRQALTDFQAANGLDRAGIVGPRTLKILRSRIADGPFAIQDFVAPPPPTGTGTSTPPTGTSTPPVFPEKGPGKKVCIPPGFNVAPPKQQLVQELLAKGVPQCKSPLPPGIMNHIPGGQGTTTGTTTPPHP